METILKKNCITCGSQVKGRSDKKFCDDYCRNEFHNRRAGRQDEIVRNVNAILKHNRKILEELAEAKKTIRVAELAMAGYRFGYCTELKRTVRGTTQFYCYEYGYSPLNSEKVKILKSAKKAEKALKNT